MPNPPFRYIYIHNPYLDAMEELLQQSKDNLLKRAKRHYFSLGLSDGASSLCRSNFVYGLAKLHIAQEHLGLEPNATFISTPDETISRNVARWKSGYGYGGKLTWGDDNDPLIFVDTKPNSCGMLVGGIDELPSHEEIIKRINDILSKDFYLDDVRINWDFKKGNHFIDVFKMDNKAVEDGLPQYAFIIHGSAPELRSDNEKGIGLYYDKSRTLREMVKKVETPFGPILYLDGADAKEYFRYFLYTKKFAAEKRILAAKLLFGKFKIISNPIHQGLRSYGEVLLGAQYSHEPGEKLFPVALRSDLPTYLMRGLQSLSEELIEELGFEKRAKKLGVYDRLRNFNSLPHGGGYSIPHISNVIQVEEIEGERFFICEQENEDAITILADVQETQFTYRGKKVVHRTVELGLGEIMYKLNPRYVLKI